MAKLLISNIPSCPFTDLKDLFSSFGPIKSISIFKESIFIDYKNYEDAKKVFLLKDKTILEKKLKIEWAFERNSKIFIGNLNKNIENVEILDFFEKFGKIKKMIRDNYNFCFLVFEDEKIAEKILKKKIFFLKNVKIEIKKPVSSQKIKDKYFCEGKSVILKNLELEVEEDELKKFLESCGTIEKIFIGARKAIVMFENEFSALKAIKYKNGKVLRDKRVFIGMYNRNKKNHIKD